MTKVRCKECGQEKEINVGDVEKLVALQRCFSCQHWHEAEVLKDDPNSVRIGGTQYFIGSEAYDKKMKGFGGNLWEIRFLDGRIVKTTNLNFIGSIPAHFRDRIPNNAEFLK